MNNFVIHSDSNKHKYRNTYPIILLAAATRGNMGKEGVGEMAPTHIYTHQHTFPSVQTVPFPNHPSP